MTAVADPGLASKMVSLHEALGHAALPHAFGGALALAFCVERARGTHDIDLNVFVDGAEWPTVVAALPNGVDVRPADEGLLQRDAQARVWWGRHPVDLFLINTAFREEAGGRVRWEEMDGIRLPFLDCGDLAVFKAFVDRSKNWVDMEEMVRAGTIDVAWVLGTLVEHLGGSDPRIERLRSLAAGVAREG